ncbi:MAG: adenylyltransferase/cytidyltransferase family protein, partial [Bacteroidota bacterium]
MQVIEGLENLRVPEQPCGICVGAFDGFHVGHQYLLSQLCALSADRGYESAVVTFEPIPSQYFLPPGSPPRRLITREERIALAASLCCDMMAILQFNDELMRWDARTFVQEVLVKRLNARLLIASGAHTMGFDRAGLDRISMV